MKRKNFYIIIILLLIIVCTTAIIIVYNISKKSNNKAVTCSFYMTDENNNNYYYSEIIETKKNIVEVVTDSMIVEVNQENDINIEEVKKYFEKEKVDIEKTGIVFNYYILNDDKDNGPISVQYIYRQDIRETNIEKYNENCDATSSCIVRLKKGMKFKKYYSLFETAMDKQYGFTNIKKYCKWWIVCYLKSLLTKDDVTDNITYFLIYLVQNADGNYKEIMKTNWS